MEQIQGVSPQSDREATDSGASEAQNQAQSDVWPVLPRRRIGELQQLAVDSDSWPGSTGYVGDARLTGRLTATEMSWLLSVASVGGMEPMTPERLHAVSEALVTYARGDDEVVSPTLGLSMAEAMALLAAGERFLNGSQSGDRTEQVFG